MIAEILGLVGIRISDRLSHNEKLEWKLQLKIIIIPYISIYVIKICTHHEEVEPCF